jgi:hypothetical protein
MEKLEKPGTKRFVTVWGVAALVIVLALISSIDLPGPRVLLAARRAKLANEFQQVQVAVLNYDAEYSIYPVAADNATLIRMLDGTSSEGNPRTIAFVGFKPSDRDAEGELLDPWGTPIELSVTENGRLHARSAGPDKIFGTQDDITGE